MMLDAETLFSDDQTMVGVAVGTVLSDKSIDLGAAEVVPGYASQKPIHDLGRGKPVEVLCQVTETFDSAADNTTLAVALVMADDEALTSNLTVLHTSATIAQAALLAGYQFRIGGTVPPGINKRYLGLRYAVGTAEATAGKITAGLVADKQTNPTV